MAFRRSITARAKLFYQQQQRVAPSFSHIHRDDSEREEMNGNPVSRNSEIRNYFQHRFVGTGNSFSTSYGSRNWFQDRRFAIPAACGPVCGRNYSTGSVEEGAADKMEILNEAVDVLGGKAVEVAEQVAPLANEVAVAAADSFFPVAALQYLIDYVHTYTGFNWWASIMVTTILIRWIQLPLIINQLKTTSKLTLLRPKLEAINEEMRNKDMSPNAVSEGQAQMKKLFKEYGVTPFSPMKGILISGPIFCSFFFAINNMAEKVPSFKEGGAFWFTDLTTPDSMYIFPVLTALTFWITVELNAQEGLEGNPTAGTIKNVSRAFAALTIPLTASFPKAIFCYWITSNLFSLTYGLVIKNPKVKEYLGLPIIPVAPPSTNQKPGLSFFETLKKYAAAQQQQSLLSPPEASPRPTTKTIPSASDLNQRIRSLEKEVKGRKKGKRR
ncbi:Inner membrane protein translocase involved in respiratory chain assembly [Handroanthus impetiginosus]|uniref:Inner membrane protein translocase involved in respiratory chain assembly n=1 Tax=Handroanthus impetiginosus TaxID=429701 RepID=A0A2G9GVC0_9LAMI|nr:Inner membrane protein translocase involved in respiratory chain assembly [Handroanthus impetiginosus]